MYDTSENIANRHSQPCLVRVAEIREFEEPQSKKNSYRFVTYFPKAESGKIIHSWVRKGDDSILTLKKVIKDFAKVRGFQLIPLPINPEPLYAINAGVIK